MKCHFGEFNKETLDFVQCQRSDGTIYGSRGGCKQKGAKEVKSNKGGEGGGGRNTSDVLSGNTSKLNQLGTHALRDVIDQVGKKATLAQSDKAKAIIEAAYKKHSAIEKSEGKTPMTITSIIPGATLKKLGIDPNKMNVSSGAKSAKTKAKSAGSKTQSKPASKGKMTVLDFEKMIVKDDFLLGRTDNKIRKAIGAMDEAQLKKFLSERSSPYSAITKLAVKTNSNFTNGEVVGLAYKRINDLREKDGKPKLGISDVYTTKAHSAEFTKGFLKGTGKTLEQAHKDGDLRGDNALWAEKTGKKTKADAKAKAEAKAKSDKAKADAKSKAEAKAKPKADRAKADAKAAASKPKPKARYTAASATQEINNMAKKYARFVKEGKLTAKEASEDLDRQAYYLSKESGNAISVRELRTTGNSTLVIATLQRLKKK